MATWRARGAELGLRDRDMAEYQVSDWQKI
jgi:hypothetical protein